MSREAITRALWRARPARLGLEKLDRRLGGQRGAVQARGQQRELAGTEAQILSGKCWTRPVLANGRIYLRNTPGTVICVDVKK